MKFTCSSKFFRLKGFSEPASLLPQQPPPLPAPPPFYALGGVAKSAPTLLTALATSVSSSAWKAPNLLEPCGVVCALTPTVADQGVSALRGRAER